MRGTEASKEPGFVGMSDQIIVKDEDLPRIMQAFARMLGKYPYKEFTLTSVPYCPEGMSVERILGSGSEEVH